MKLFKKLSSFTLVFMLVLLSFFTTAPTGYVLEHEEDYSDGVVHTREVKQGSDWGRAQIDYSASSLDDSTYPDAAKKSNDIPASYDSRDYGYVTSVKNQSIYPICWTHAATSASESSLIKHNGYELEDIDLSELHLAYYTYGNAYDKFGMLSGDYTTLKSGGFITAGGMFYMTVMSLARWTGIIDQNKNTAYSTENISSQFTREDTSEAYSLNEAILENGIWISSKDKDEIKLNIMKYGSGVMAYYHNSSYLCNDNESGDFAYYYNSTKAANHEVCVVGWDDNFSVENFNEDTRPSSDGAWLIKNSYGPSWGNDGYFWLSYEDTSLLREDTCFFSYTSTDKYASNYQYDGSVAFTDYSDGTNPSYGGYTGGGYMANVFTANSAEEIKAVSFFTLETNVSYEIQIYKNLTSGDPSSGTSVLAEPLSGTQPYCGFHTIELPESVKIETGEKFSVSVRLFRGTNKLVSLMCDITDSSWSWISFTNSAHEGQSFFSKGGTNWEDLSKSKGINFRIKALTVSSEEVETDTQLGTDSISDTDTSVTTQTDTETNSDVITDTDTLLSTETDTSTEVQTDTETNSDVITDTDTLISTETDTSTEAQTDTETNSDVITDTDTLISTETDTSTEVQTDTETNSDVSPDSDIIILPGTDTESDINTDLPFNTDTEPDNDTDEENTQSEAYLKLLSKILDVELWLDSLSDSYIDTQEYKKLKDVIDQARKALNDSSSDDILISLYNEICLYEDLINKLKIEYLYGDVNCDGEIKMTDVTTLQRIIAKLISFEDLKPNSGVQSDVNHDGFFTMADVVLIQKYLAHLVTSL